MQDPDETKERLIRAGEVLFARDGVDGARIRELNELAGQRNPSALHYHFGSREGLVSAILLQHQAEIDRDVAPALDRLADEGKTEDVRAVVDAVVRPMASQLTTERGRRWALIVPHRLPLISDRLRQGGLAVITEPASRVLGLLEAELRELPVAVRRERLVAYSTIVTTLLAERAHQLEGGGRPALSHEQFVVNTVDVLVGVLTAPSTVRVRRR